MPTTVAAPIANETQAQREQRLVDLAHSRLTGLADTLDGAFFTVASALGEIEGGEISREDLEHLSEIVRRVLTELYGNGRGDASHLVELALQLEAPGLGFANALRRLADERYLWTRRNKPAVATAR